MQMRYRIRGSETLIGKQGILATIEDGKVKSKVQVDQFGVLPVFDTNAGHRYWISGGTLYKANSVLPGTASVFGSDTQHPIGQVLQNQTLFWAGPKFGFGFYRAGEISVGFVFDAEKPGIKDISIPITGQLIDSTCVFSDKLCWFLLSTREGSKIINHCHVVQADGKVITSISAEKGTEPWLESLRGKLALGNSLFVPTDDGLKRFDLRGGKVEETQEFPDTEPFVDADSVLLSGKQGIYVVSNNEITLIQMQ